MHSIIYSIFQFPLVDFNKMLCQAVVCGWNGNSYYMRVLVTAVLLLINHTLSNMLKYTPSGDYQAKDKPNSLILYTY